MSLEYRVIYADTDSIFAWVRGKSRDECTEAAMKLTRAADDSIKNIPFEDIRADIKGGLHDDPDHSQESLASARLCWTGLGSTPRLQLLGSTREEVSSSPYVMVATFSLAGLVTEVGSPTTTRLAWNSSR